MEPELQARPEEYSLDAVEFAMILQNSRQRRLDAIAGIVERVFLGELQRLVGRVVVLENGPIAAGQGAPSRIAGPRQSQNGRAWVEAGIA